MQGCHGQGKSQEKDKQSGKFRKFKEKKSLGIQKKIHKKLVVNRILINIFSINRKQCIFRNIPFPILMVCDFSLKI